MTRKYISRLELVLLYIRIFLRVLPHAVRTADSPYGFLCGLGRALRSRHSKGFNGPTIKTCRHNGRYYWHLNVPGYPSPAFDRILRHLAETKIHPGHPEGLYTGLVAITRKCPLCCRHCYEWDVMNRMEEPEESQLIATIDRIIRLGAAQIILGGGEPASRFATILHILDHFRGDGVDFWINTSGAGLDVHRIKEMRSHGLAGILFSLDHVDEKEHDQFRGRDGCWRHVLSLARDAGKTGLLTALSLCPTNRFVSRENLESYMKLAAELGCMFVQVLEPKPAGRNADCSLQLSPDSIETLDRFFSQASLYADWPILSCPDHDRRRFGCYGGRYYLYVDAAGRAFPCPFHKEHPASLTDLSPLNYTSLLSCPFSV